MRNIPGYRRSQSCAACIHFSSGLGFDRAPFCTLGGPPPPQGDAANDASGWLRAMLAYATDRTIERDGWCPDIETPRHTGAGEQPKA